MKLYPEACQQTTFVDIDYPALIRRKRDVVLSEVPFIELLVNVKTDDKSEIVYLQADNYAALGCDLKRVEQLSTLLQEHLHIQDCSILFLAEAGLQTQRSTFCS
jgi:tRNA wybutosine-synthesizing protein 4